MKEFAYFLCNFFRASWTWTDSAGGVHVSGSILSSSLCDVLTSSGGTVWQYYNKVYTYSKDNSSYTRYNEWNTERMNVLNEFRSTTYHILLITIRRWGCGN